MLAGLLWAAGVGAEIVRQPQHPDGSVAAPVLFGVCTALAVTGSACLLRAFRGIRAAVSDTSRPSTRAPGRALRAGTWCGVAGAGLLLVFSAATLVSGLATGGVWEPLFLAFALGMVALVVGQLALGLALRRHDAGARGVWPSLLVASACVVVALGVPVDPWHDLGLFGLFAAWVALGCGLHRLAGKSAGDHARGLVAPGTARPKATQRWARHRQRVQCTNWGSRLDEGPGTIPGRLRDSPAVGDARGYGETCC